MPYPSSARQARPLDPPMLDALAINYVGRYATTRARLATYLRRKIALRGWAPDDPPLIEAIVERLAVAGYVDDRAFAEGRARSLASRGYGHRRVALALDTAGVARSIADDLAPDRDGAFVAAERYARRRRFGSFGASSLSPADRQRQFAAMVRAGHDYELARHFTETASREINRTE